MTTRSKPAMKAWKVPASGINATPQQPEVVTAPVDITESSGINATLKRIPIDFVPSTDAEMMECIKDPQWRICSGQLYKIMVKAPDGDGNSVVPFIPNRSQRRLMSRLWYRNIVLKARQLGFTTLVAILWLDHALFNADQRCGIIAQDRDAAKIIFRDKVKLAYERLPAALLEMMPVAADNVDELLFAHNNSSFRVATSMRSGTIHRLHISEYGKICAKYPEKAIEISTGSLPAVPLDGITIIESTAEGQEGDFHDKTQIAIANAQRRKKLTPKDFRIHFFPWWQEPGYRIAESEPLNDKDRAYFDEIEAQTGVKIDLAQRNWYVATRDGEFSGDPEKMWQEYPSTAKEAFQVSTEGTYYAVQLTALRKEGRLCHVPFIPGIPVNTFWDIGNTDGTAIWFHQRLGFDDRFINFIEGWGEPYGYFVREMQALGYVWGTHYLPHDAAHKRQGKFANQSPEDMLRELMPGSDFQIVPAVDEILHGIQLTRDAFGSMFFDETKCSLGIAHLGSYRKTWDKTRSAWRIHTPSKTEGHSEAADALRQFAQGYTPPRLIEGSGGAKRNWRTA